MPSTIDPARTHRKIAVTVGLTPTLQDPSSSPQPPLAPRSSSSPLPSPVAAPMAFRSRGQPLLSRGHLLNFSQNPEKDHNGMVHRLKARLSSWKLLTRRSKTHANLASLCPAEDGDEPPRQADKPMSIARTCTLADLDFLGNHRVYQRTPSPRGDETYMEDTAQHFPPAAGLITEPNPFADEDMFNTSLNSVLRTEPDPLGSSTPRRVLSVLDPNLPTVRRQSVSKVEKRSSLIKQESGLNRAFLARMRSSSDIENLVPFEIPERRSSIVCLAGSLKNHRPRRSSSQTAKTEEHMLVGNDSVHLCKTGHGRPRTPSYRSSFYSSHLGSTVQDPSFDCYRQRSNHAKRPSSPCKKAPHLHHKPKNHELRFSLPPSPARSDATNESLDWVDSEAGYKHANMELKQRIFQDADQKPRKMAFSSSVPLLVAPPPPNMDLGDTIYKCFPVEHGKKHPSPTKFEWEDIKEKWQMGVTVQTHELLI